MHALDPPEPASFIRPEHDQPTPPGAAPPDEAIGPAAYNTGLSAEEGL